ncbi:hypothetical protein Tco_0237550 [Tanacetum coccineum]
MSGTNDENPPPPPPQEKQQTPTQQTSQTVSTIKLPILKKGEYDIWAMKIEHYLAHTDYPIWEVIQNGNGPVSVTTDTSGQIKILPPKTGEEVIDGESVDWTTHSEDNENYAFMASNISGSNTQREELSDATAKINLILKVLRKLKHTQKEKDDLEVIVNKWNHSSKNLGKIINYSMSARDKFGLGYGDYRYSGNLSYENEVFQSVFRCNKSDSENLRPLHKALLKQGAMQEVPPPMTGIYFCPLDLI